MRILFYALTENQGGIENFIFNYFFWMKKENIHLTLFAMGSKAVYEEEFQNMGAEIIHLPPKKNRLLFYKYMDNKVRSGNFDVVWFNDNNLCDIHLLKAAKKYNVPIRICHAHNSAMEKNKLKLFRHQWHSRSIEKYATDLWTCSDKAARWAYGRLWESRNVKEIPNAVDVEKFYYTEEKRACARRKLGVGDQLAIGHVGRFCEAKNHKFLLDIYSYIVTLCPDSVLILIGQGELREMIEQDIMARGLVSKVKLLGQREDVAEIIQGFDVMVMPSLFEGFPVAVVEAQAAGVPCVLSDTVTRKVDISDTVVYISLEKKAKEWAEEILSAAAHVDRDAMSEKVLRSAYNIKKAARSLEEWFERRDK